MLLRAIRDYRPRAANLHGAAVCLLGPVALLLPLATSELGQLGRALATAVVYSAFVTFSVGVTRVRAQGQTGDGAFWTPASVVRAATGRRGRTTAAASLVAGALVAGGLELRVLPGLLLAGLLWPLAGILARERRGPLESVIAAITWVRGDLIATVVLGLVFAGLALGVHRLVEIVAAPLGTAAAATSAAVAAVCIVGPLAAVAFDRGYRLHAAGRRLALLTRSRPPHRAASGTPATAPEEATLTFRLDPRAL